MSVGQRFKFQVGYILLDMLELCAFVETKFHLLGSDGNLYALQCIIMFLMVGEAHPSTLDQLSRPRQTPLFGEDLAVGHFWLMADLSLKTQVIEVNNQENS